MSAVRGAVRGVAVIYAINLETGAVEPLTLDEFVAAIDIGALSAKTHEVSLSEERARRLGEEIVASAA